MVYRRIELSLPEELLQAVDQAARERSESRSRFVCRVLELALRARRDAEVTMQLDALFGDDGLRESQRREATDLETLAADWLGERW